jgi:hypothetical protein
LNALSANQGRVLNEKIFPLTNEETDKFTISVERVYNSSIPLEYWITTITPKNNESLKTLLKKDFAYTSTNVFSDTAKEIPFYHADRSKSTFAINASGWDAGGTEKIHGIQIKDGVVYQNNASLTNWYTLGVNRSGILNVFPNTMTGSDLIAQDIVNTWSFSIPIILNGVEVDSTIYSKYSAYNQLYARQIIGQVTGTNEIIILTVDKSSSSQGITLPNAAAILLAKNCRVAYNLDGGGSAQTIYKGNTINNPSDGTYRATSDLLYLSKYDNYQTYLNIQKEVTDAKGGFDTLRDKINQLQRFKMTLDDGTIDYTNNTPLDYNSIKGTKYFRHYTDVANSANDLNAPFSGSVDVYGINIQSSYTSACQIVFDRQSKQMAFRFNNLGTWGSWATLRDKVVYTAPATLLNSWVNLGGADPVLQYCLKDGIVYIKGVVKGGAASTVITTLPVGMRPLTRYVKTTVVNNGSVAVGRIFIDPNGNLTSLDAASGYLYIEACYPAEQ